MNPDAYVITILITSGDPDGVRMVEKSNWTGRGVVFARSDLPVALGEGLDSPGVYILIGDDPEDEFDQQIYIGQGEDVGRRLKQHQADDSKDFWEQTVVFVSDNDSLNRAHISYLESSLIRLASEAKRARMVNANHPPGPRMSDIDLAVANGFLAEMLAILPVLGLDVFVTPGSSVPSDGGRYHLRGPGAEGEGEERSEGFLVLAGSRARADEVPSMPKSGHRLRQRLIATGTLIRDGDAYRLTEDTLFRSPSAAASVLLGSSANGRTAWKDEEGVTLKERQLERLRNTEQS